MLDALCQQLLARLPGSCVRWEELVYLNPLETLLDLGTLEKMYRKACFQ